MGPGLGGGGGGEWGGCDNSLNPQSLEVTFVGGIAPNQVIARSEFEVHRQMYTQ